MRIFSSVKIVLLYVSFAGAMVTKVHNGSLITIANGQRDPVRYLKNDFKRSYSYVIKSSIVGIFSSYTSSKKVRACHSALNTTVDLCNCSGLFLKP